MEKIYINKDNCIKCGACMSIASETFSQDEEGFSKVINDEITENAKEAANCCPTGAIEIK